jgi:hypothetical protein
MILGVSARSAKRDETMSRRARTGRGMTLLATATATGTLSQIEQ